MGLVHKFIKFVENLTVIRIFLLTIILPTALTLLSIGLMQHTGTTYKVTHEVYFDITVAGEPTGRIVIGLFGETAPKTVQNFFTLATVGVNGLKYEGSTFHRIVKKFMIQGGDVYHKDGMGRVSIYGDTFPDENFDVKHATLGFVAMANSGPDTNGCQFYITTVSTPWLDGKHVVFGKVVEGQGLVHQIEHLEADLDSRPTKEVRIAKAGSRKVKSTYTISDDPYNVWDWLRTISMPLSFSFCIVFVFNHIIKVIEKGIMTEDKIREFIEQEKQRKLVEENLVDGERVSGGEEGKARRRVNAKAS